MKHRLAIFVSGNGSNARVIMDYFGASSKMLIDNEANKSGLQAEIALMVSNKYDIGALRHAAHYHIPSLIFPTLHLRQQPEFLLESLRANRVTFIVLAGFLAKVPSNITEAFRDKMVNIHPSLLPAYGGKGMYGDRVHEAVLADGCTESGITIHKVNDVYDDGEILHQERVPIENGEGVESLRKKIQALEHYWYPRVIERTLIAQSH